MEPDAGMVTVKLPSGVAVPTRKAPVTPKIAPLSADPQTVRTSIVAVTASPLTLKVAVIPAICCNGAAFGSAPASSQFPAKLLAGGVVCPPPDVAPPDPHPTAPKQSAPATSAAIHLLVPIKPAYLRADIAQDYFSFP